MLGTRLGTGEHPICTFESVGSHESGDHGLEGRVVDRPCPPVYEDDEDEEPQVDLASCDQNRSGEDRGSAHDVGECHHGATFVAIREVTRRESHEKPGKAVGGNHRRNGKGMWVDDHGQQRHCPVNETITRAREREAHPEPGKGTPEPARLPPARLGTVIESVVPRPRQERRPPLRCARLALWLSTERQTEGAALAMERIAQGGGPPCRYFTLQHPRTAEWCDMTANHGGSSQWLGQRERRTRCHVPPPSP